MKLHPLQFATEKKKWLHTNLPIQDHIETEVNSLLISLIIEGIWHCLCY